MWMVGRRAAISQCKALVRCINSTTADLLGAAGNSTTCILWLVYFDSLRTESCTDSDTKHGLRPLYLDNAATTPMVGGVVG